VSGVCEVVDEVLVIEIPGRLTRRGDAAGAEELAGRMFEEIGDRLVGLACVLLRDRGDAEDVVQEAFLRFQRHAGSIRTEGREAAYLRSIVLNLARSRLRRQRLARWKHAPPPPPGNRPEEVVELRDEQRRVVAALRTLPARQRECLVLRYFDGLADAEIAETLGVAITSVRTHMQRGKATLERILNVTQPETAR
jgi:RNA polymerase sigma-70 factor (sigma-E family)